MPPTRPGAPAVHARPRWALTEAHATPRGIWLRRRQVLRALGLGALATASPAALLATPGSGVADDGARRAAGRPPTGPHPPAPADVAGRYPALRSDTHRAIPDRAITPERLAGGYNNYYEFGTDKRGVWRNARAFPTRPWTIEVTGRCARPTTFDADDLQRRFPLEERVYRFRCVEAWSMVVPWTGLPLAPLLDAVEPASDARFVRFVSFDRRDQAVGQRTQPWYPWPYFEGLRMDEARHPLTLLATGIYGHPLPNQHGAPVRLVVPWKYGYKSAKGIVRIELVREQPPTFWNDLAPREYDFLSNVRPEVPHPRWSQATERDLATGDRIPTLPFNGYADEVARLYGAAGG